MSIRSHSTKTNIQKCYLWARVSTFNAHEGLNGTPGTQGSDLRKMWLLERKIRPFLTPRLSAIMAVVNGVCGAAA